MVSATRYLALWVGFLLMASCEEVFPGKACTEEFRSIVVEIQGLEPDDVYTLRLATGDTLRFTKDNIPIFNQTWVVLDDSFMRILDKRGETFRLEAIADGEVKIREDFIIRSDGCHVELIDGPSIIRY